MQVLMSLHGSSTWSSIIRNMERSDFSRSRLRKSFKLLVNFPSTCELSVSSLSSEEGAVVWRVLSIFSNWSWMRWTLTPVDEFKKAKVLNWSRLLISSRLFLNDERCPSSTNWFRFRWRERLFDVGVEEFGGSCVPVLIVLWLTAVWYVVFATFDVDGERPRPSSHVNGLEIISRGKGWNIGMVLLNRYWWNDKESSMSNPIDCCILHSPLSIHVLFRGNAGPYSYINHQGAKERKEKNVIVVTIDVLNFSLDTRGACDHKWICDTV